MIDLRDKIETEPIEGDKTREEHCKEDEKEGGTQEAIQETRFSEQDTSGIDDRSDFM
jgi:hypothetical protein